MQYSITGSGLGFGGGFTMVHSRRHDQQKTVSVGIPCHGDAFLGSPRWERQFGQFTAVVRGNMGIGDGGCRILPIRQTGTPAAAYR